MMRITQRNCIRHIAFLLAFAAMIMTLLLLSACDGDGKVSDQPPASVISESEDYLTIVDQAGREVSVKKDPESIALCYRVAIRFLLSLDQGDRIRGIGKSEEFLEQLQPSLKDCVDVGKGVADIEALAELDPDLFIHKADDTETLEAVEKIGIPAVGIEVETPEDMMVALDLLGKVCGTEEKAGKLREYYESRLEEIEAAVSKLKEDDLPDAIVMGSSPGKVADGSMLQGEMLERAGAVNSAGRMKATELWPTAGIEQIFKWDPDYIFVTGSESAVYSAEDILKDPAWSEISAVRKKQVYDLPAERDSWEFPGPVSVLGIEYMLHIMHPELISEKHLADEVDAFYELSYGRKFTREELGY